MTTIDPSPLFSIITITKDNLEGLKRTAESVLAQSFADYEWIIVDGASNDETPTYLKTLPARGISEPDDGLYDAMNKGMDRAHGRYLIFMNAGDVFSDPDILTTIARSAKTDDPDFLYGDALETNGLYKKARSHEKIAWGMFTHHQAMIYRRTPLRYDTQYKIAADYDFTVRFLKNANNVHYIPCAICLFEDGGISQQRKEDGRREQFEIRKQTRLCGRCRNRIIRAAQTASASLKVTRPTLYRALKSFMTGF